MDIHGSPVPRLRQGGAKNHPGGQLGRMSAFFTVLGDILALFALQPDLVEQYQGLCSLPAKESDCPADRRQHLIG